MIYKEFVIIFLWRMIGLSCQSKRPYRDVLTTQGRVRGYLFPEPPHYAFLGIPYARLPSRNARFKAPEPPTHWDGIFEATHRIKCPQIDEDGVEDCLVINVFTPEHGILLPVMVHIHDGDFQTGWGSYRAPLRLLKENVIIVTFNYRLGAFGFLCLGASDAPGNAGLKDQIAALYWVQRNIKNFGGNSMDVTVYGTGSGAVAAELLLISGSTTGLFHRVILESGTALAPTSMTYTPFSTALKVGSLLGFDGKATPNELAQFFMDVAMKKVINSTEMFLPCVERDVYNTNSLLDMDPLDSLKEAHFFHIPIMIAYSNALEVKIISNDLDRFRSIPNDFENLLPDNLDFENEDFKTRLARLVKEFYFGENEIGTSLIPNYVDYVNDIFIEYPVVKSAILHARATHPVYILKFTYKGTLSNMKEEEIPGAGHGDLYTYLFTNEHLTREEQLVTERLVTLVTNFIKIGDPTPLTTTLLPVIWEPVPYTQNIDGKITVVPYLLFDKTPLNQLLPGQQLIFWDHIYNKFYKRHEDV